MHEVCLLLLLDIMQILCLIPSVIIKIFLARKLYHLDFLMPFFNSWGVSEIVILGYA